MSKYFIFFIYIISLTFADDLDTKKGTINGILIVRYAMESEKYFIVDFQGSSAKSIKECSCHTSLNGKSTSGKSSISLAPGSGGWIILHLPSKGKYEVDLSDGKEFKAIMRLEKGKRYYSFYFHKQIKITSEDRSSLYIDEGSSLIFALSE